MIGRSILIFSDANQHFHVCYEKNRNEWFNWDNVICPPIISRRRRCHRWMKNVAGCHWASQIVTKTSHVVPGLDYRCFSRSWNSVGALFSVEKLFVWKFLFSHKKREFTISPVVPSDQSPLRDFLFLCLEWNVRWWSSCPKFSYSYHSGKWWTRKSCLMLVNWKRWHLWFFIVFFFLLGIKINFSLWFFQGDFFL